MEIWKLIRYRDRSLKQACGFQVFCLSIFEGGERFLVLKLPCLSHVWSMSICDKKWQDGERSWYRLLWKKKTRFQKPICHGDMLFRQVCGFVFFVESILKERKHFWCWNSTCVRFGMGASKRRKIASPASPQCRKGNDVLRILVCMQ